MEPPWTALAVLPESENSGIPDSHRPGLLEKLGHEGVPLSLRPKDQLDRFADSAAASAGLRDICGVPFDVVGCVGNRDWKTDSPHRRQIHHFVSDERDVFDGNGS